MTALLFLLTALPLTHAAPQSPQPRGVVVSSGDEIVVPPGTNARIVSRHAAHLRILVAADPREVLVLVDEEKDGGQPDGLVDRVFRYTLQEDFPPQCTFSGEGAVEDALDIKDGDVRRPASLTYVTPAGRLRFTPPEEREPGTTFFRATASHGATLTIHTPGSRLFPDVEYVWLNHLENTRTGVSIRNDRR